MAKILEILKQRVTTTDSTIDSTIDSIGSWLLTKTQSIISQSTNHLKGVARVMPEFDLHDSIHSAAVLEIIENILGDSAHNLSSFELFYIIASSYLHDCGMAISDYEKKVMELTEGTDDVFINNASLKNDGKKCLSFAAAKDFVTRNKKDIYQDYNGDIKNWLFIPAKEEELINYLSNLLAEYQDFRNRNYATIKKCTNKKDFETTNQSLRTEYIRSTHHKRIAEYIRNLGQTKFVDFPINGLNQRIANDLAAVCKAHGENPEYVGNLSTHIEYCGHDSINLQFVAMLLRLGDIVHFSYDRAPLELRALHQFNSSYSFEQWRVKAGGVNYDISNGTIAFRAYISNPSDYYLLHHYINWIDNELQLFIQLSSKWDKQYKVSIKDKVDRSNIAYNASVFEPVAGLKFTLDQKRILELLMGVGLYKEKFACIRELYQNSLDACRYQIAKDNANGKKSHGIIEFGIGEDNGEKYLYCLDNGKGMSKSIIEKYLLKIGNSYYQSPEFYQSQAETGFAYTPTSQFGIGILSCFIIGDRIEIVTKEEAGKHIACSIDGPCEYFYYKHPSKLDEGLIKTSGTVVKVFLKKENYDIINTKEIINLNLVSYNQDAYIQQLNPDLQDDYANWNHSLYKVINSFIVIVPEHIELFVKWDNSKKQKILSKPYIYSLDTLKKSDLDIIDKYQHRFGPVSKFKLKDYINLVDCHIFDVQDKGMHFRTIMKLPKPGMELYGYELIKNIPVEHSFGISVDGISAHGNFGLYSFTEILTLHGIVNFYGENRPQLSVDRKDLIKEDDGRFETISKELIRKIIETAIDNAHRHIQKYDIHKGSELYNMVWESVFRNFGYSSSILFEVLAQHVYNDIEWNNLSLYIGKNITIGEFINRSNIQIQNYDYRKFDSVSRILLLNKLSSALEIEVDANDVRIFSQKLNNKVVLDCDSENKFEMNIYLVRTNNHGNTFDEYDIISNLYPIVPAYLYDLVEGHNEELSDSHFKKISNFSNGMAAFYEQSPLEIDEELGLYLEERDVFNRKVKHIRSLNKKRSPIGFPDIRIPNNAILEIEKCRLALTVYIAPRVLSDDERMELSNYKESNPAYYKGVMQGWSIMVTGEPDEKMNTYIKAGKCTRKEMVKLIPQSFWKKFKDHTHMFPDGKLLKDILDEN